MLIAWMTTVSTGVIVARHFKHDWLETRLFGQQVWFQVRVIVWGEGLIVSAIF